MGVEPIPPFEERILSPLRLPFRHVRFRRKSRRIARVEVIRCRRTIFELRWVCYRRLARRPSIIHKARMKIATYNVNGVNGRLPVLLRWLAQSRPDIVCLQELKAPQEKFPEAAIRDAGYGAVWHGQKSWNAVAILSRWR
jgi:endonuclease/exonuclease/phosphatase (EEP) superfamily protein YafD